MSGQTAVADLSAVAYKYEAAFQGGATGPFRWLYWDGNTLNADPDFIKKSVAGASRASHRVLSTGLFKNAGNLQCPVYPTHAAPLYKGTFGVDTYLTALAADTVKAATPITTSGGISTINLTNTAAATYTVGGLVQVGTGANLEVRMIESVSGNGAAGTILTVAALITNAAAAAGTAVQQLQQHQFTTNSGAPTLPSLYLEDNIGGQYSETYKGVYINGWDAKGGKDTIDQTFMVFGTVMRARQPVPTTPAPSAAELADLNHPFMIEHGVICAVGDPTASGTSAQQYLSDVETWDVSWKNGIVEKPLWGAGQSYMGYPGTQELTVKMTRVNPDKRETDWEDYLAQLYTKTQTMSIMAWYNNGGTPYAWGLRMPALVVSKAQKVTQLGQVIGVSLDFEGDMLTAQGDLIQAFVSNADTTAY